MKTTVLYVQLARKFPTQIGLCTLLFLFEVFFAFLNVATFAPLADILLDKPADEWMSVTQWIASFCGKFGITLDLYVAAIMVWISMTLLGIATVAVKAGIQVFRAAVVQQLIRDVYQSNFSAGWGHLRTVQSGKLINTFLTETAKVGISVSTLAQFVSVTLRFFAFITIPMLVAPKLVIFVSVGCLLALAPFLYLGRLTARQGVLNVDAQNRFVGLIKSSIDGSRDVIAFGKEENVLTRVIATHWQVMLSMIKGTVLALAASQFFEPVAFAVLLLTVWLLDGSTLGLAVIGTVIWGMLRAIPALKHAIQLKHQLDLNAASLVQVYRFMSFSNDNDISWGKRKLAAIKSSIRLASVDLKFDETSVLRNITLEIPASGKVVLVGESGSGKSTVVDIIMGLQQPTAGQVVVDGVERAKLERESYIRKFALVSQTTFLFDLTIRENLLWVSPGASEEQLIAACKTAGIYEFVTQCTEQFDTLLGGNGYRLSGGQAQRLSIARALLCDPDVLILDEATSAIDAENEAVVIENLDSAMKEKTILMVTHKIANTQNADSIYVMRDGRIVEWGSYDSLMEQKGYFSNLSLAQSESPQ